MKTNRLVRGVALVLIPCLIADMGAAAFPSSATPTRHVTFKPLFSEQALSAASLSNRRLDRYIITISTFWKHLQATPLWANETGSIGSHRTNPHDTIKAHIAQAKALRSQGRFDEALQLLYTALRQIEDARNYLPSFRKHWPPSKLKYFNGLEAQVRRNLAATHREMGQIREALASLSDDGENLKPNLQHDLNAADILRKLQSLQGWMMPLLAGALVYGLEPQGVIVGAAGLFTLTPRAIKRWSDYLVHGEWFRKKDTRNPEEAFLEVLNADGIDLLRAGLSAKRVGRLLAARAGQPFGSLQDAENRLIAKEHAGRHRLMAGASSREFLLWLQSDMPLLETLSPAWEMRARAIHLAARASEEQIARWMDNAWKQNSSHGRLTRRQHILNTLTERLHRGSLNDLGELVEIPGLTPTSVILFAEQLYAEVDEPLISSSQLHLVPFFLMGTLALLLPLKAAVVLAMLPPPQRHIRRFAQAA